jgi:hypothetical protein
VRLNALLVQVVGVDTWLEGRGHLAGHGIPDLLLVLQFGYSRPKAKRSDYVEAAVGFDQDSWSRNALLICEPILAHAGPSFTKTLQAQGGSFGDTKHRFA